MLLCLHFEVVLVQSTLRLLLPPGPSPRTFPFVPLPALHRAVPVPHTPVALIQQLVVRDVVLLDVPVYERKCPREERVQLQQPRLVHFERLQGGTGSPLGGSPTSDHGLYTQLGVGPPGGFYL